MGLEVTDFKNHRRERSEVYFLSDVALSSWMSDYNLLQDVNLCIVRTKVRLQKALGISDRSFYFLLTQSNHRDTEDTKISLSEEGRSTII